VSALKSAGDYARANDIRITTHPGPFVVLSSPNEKVVKNSITNLETHGKLLDMMGLSTTPYNKINIHCNGVYGDKKSAMNRFCDNYNKLSHSVKSRLTVENDDKPSMYSVLDLMYIHDRIKIPITFDYHHHIFCSGGLPEKNALELAFNTWPDGIRPVVHYSESKEGNRPQCHSDYIKRIPNSYGFLIDIMLECKAKELALLNIRDKLNSSK
jgi:UV DNA damage endonuclease